ncbi:response regulator transcription factor [Aquabacterium sp.]|jgi:two-component system, NarL family, nitrate/nitrite response regulator NarL|uniref:response regulator n=1 Tax=Aquabacterium sp. TaxID=1872578 RepID=UPI002488036D|nr:response regulator transcription factor [Aquabacterium sp.]MDI1349415.1 response regulator transcription factor [Aquabacterium sp.]
MPIRLLVVDDHTLFRRGLMALLARDERVTVVAEAADAGEALRHAAQHQPDVVLLDNHLPGVHGIDALPQLLALQPAPKVLMLTVSEDADDLALALSRGASGYLLKTVEGQDLIDAIEAVHRGESAVSPEMTSKLVAAYRHAVGGAPVGAPPLPVEPELATSATPATPAAPTASAAPATPHPLSRLSPRERDILREIARGASNKEIARTLDIAETTVKIHVQHILRKLNLSSRVQAAVLASGDSAI